MRRLPVRPNLPRKTQVRLNKETAKIIASPSPIETAAKRYAAARKAKWFEPVLKTLGAMTGPGEPCMLCDANESTDVEHYRPKAVFPHLALVWGNLLWGCTNCNRHKGNQFPPDTKPGARLIDPIEENVWDYFLIDRFGNLIPKWRQDTNALDERAVSTRDLLYLNRETLQARRHSRLNDLRQLTSMTLNQLHAGTIQVGEARERLKEWRSSPTQPDVADYFLGGPGSSEQPFCNLLAILIGAA
jgi:uncharacterized protein (TIGR02646 family)